MIIDQSMALVRFGIALPCPIKLEGEGNLTFDNIREVLQAIANYSHALEEDAHIRNSKERNHSVERPENYELLSTVALERLEKTMQSTGINAQYMGTFIWA